MAEKDEPQGHGPPQRSARLVLVLPDGALVGCLPPVAVSTPWWQDAAPVVAAARERFGLDILVLRLLETERDRPQGGAVTYLAETARPVKAELWNRALPPHPLRQIFAEPGGPPRLLQWASHALASHGIKISGPPEQFRTWNLSSIWRISTDHQTVWLKSVPPFFAHEGPLLSFLQGQPVPRILAHQKGNMLLADIAGEDMHEAGQPALNKMVTLLVDIQAGFPNRTGELLKLGLPDWRAPSLTALIEDVFSRTRRDLDPADLSILDHFVARLPARFSELADCGLPDTLVHGDFHPGNLRGSQDAFTLLDWGDSGIGHPLLDQPAFLEHRSLEERSVIKEHWREEWRKHHPDADLDRAARLLAPVAAARQAVVYRKFLDNIEPSEQVYHQFDPATWLGRAGNILRGE